MKKQSFLVYVRIETEIGTGSEEKVYLTEARVKKQVQKFLSGRNLAEGLPCHGTSTILVTEVIETTKK